MKIRVIGAGIYGCHIALALIRAGHDVVVHEVAARPFSGTTGNIPARLHQGQHYCRSKLTRAACQEHFREFMSVYGDFTRGVPVNVYAIAEHESWLDFGTYTQVLRGEIEFVTVERPAEFGLRNVEGAILTGERHILVNRLRDHFARELDGMIEYGKAPGLVDDPRWDLNIDCTFCAHENVGVDRYEVCLMLLMQGPTDRAMTIMDGGFPSLYPWDEERGLSSLTSAKWTPLYRSATWAEAKAFIDGPDLRDAVQKNGRAMVDQMRSYYEATSEYGVAGHRVTIRAMPRSAADARLVDIIRTGERTIRIRAGKLDAIFHAERVVGDMLADFG